MPAALRLQYLIGMLWNLTGAGLIYLGLTYVYLFSAPNTLLLDTIPFHIAIGKVFTGTCALFIGCNLLLKVRRRLHIILPMSLLIALYFLLGLSQFGPLIIQFSGENILFLILLILTWKVIYRCEDIGEAMQQLKRKKNGVITALVLGIIPVILSLLLDYAHFAFWHQFSL